MRKRLIILIILTIIFILPACERQVSEPINNGNVENNNKSYKEEDNLLFKLAKEGKIDGINFGIDSYSGDIIEKWGMPDDYDYFMGGLYFRYVDEGVVFFTDSYMDNGKIEYGDVLRIGVYKENKEIFNVRIGMTFEEIMSILGDPSYKLTPEQTQDSEFYDGSWIITYDVEGYSVTFKANDENGPVSVGYLFKNK